MRNTVSLQKDAVLGEPIEDDMFVAAFEYLRYNSKTGDSQWEVMIFDTGMVSVPI